MASVIQNDPNLLEQTESWRHAVRHVEEHRKLETWVDKTSKVANVIRDEKISGQKAGLSEIVCGSTNTYATTSVSLNAGVRT